MWDSRQNVKSVTHIHVYRVAWIVSFDDGCPLKTKENVACVSMPMPRDAFVSHE